MSVARIQTAMSVELARCATNARNHLDRYFATGDPLHLIRFDREAEAQQVLAHRADAAKKLAKAWGK